jgi:hypothetical protein
MWQNIKIISSKNPADMKIIDLDTGQEIKGVVNLAYYAAAGVMPKLTLEMVPESIQIGGGMEVVQRKL